MPSRRKKSIILIAAGIILLLLSISGLLFPFVPLIFSDVRFLSDNIPPATDSATAPIDAGAADTASADMPIAYGQTATSASKTPAADTNRLIIPSIGVSVDVVEGKDAGALLYGAWRYPGTSAPPRGGNTVLFGHRFRYLPPNNTTFFYLDKLKTSDEIAVEWHGKTYHYRVSGSKVIAPDDFSIMAQTSTPTLTLVTCTPLFSTKNRLVVTAERY
jgi:LPXTG-site transpeptidase (sortase) family protein